MYVIYNLVMNKIIKKITIWKEQLPIWIGENMMKLFK